MNKCILLILFILILRSCADFTEYAQLHSQARAPLSSEVFLQLMGRDKKVSGGQLRLVLQRGALGCAVLTSDFDQDLLRHVVAEYCAGKEAASSQ